MKSHSTFLIFIAALGLHPLIAQESPTPSPTPNVPPPAATDSLLSSTSAAPARTPVDMFAQDYDEANDVFLVPGTKHPYNGPVFSKSDTGVLESQGTLKNGHEDGLWTEFYENGKKVSEGVYNEGVEVGDWKYWYDNGNIQSEGAYSDGVPTGRWKTYFESGKPESEGVYIRGKNEGDWKSYDEETGALSVEKYKDGVQLTP